MKSTFLAPLAALGIIVAPAAAIAAKAPAPQSAKVKHAKHKKGKTAENKTPAAAPATSN